jgi:undecaprenyl diphosphate synthase
MEMTNMPSHVAIILDGNGRWAKKRKQPRSYGHYMGGRNLFNIANIANQLGIKKLSVFAFSTENWKRPKEEVDYLLTKPIELYYQYEERFSKITYRITFAGRRDRFSKELQEVIDSIEKKTSLNQGLELTICLDYGSHDELLFAFNQSKETTTKDSIESHLYVKEPVDLLIRTSGEQRLSNFLLWQSAYAELYFTKVHWPAFSKRHLLKAIKNYQKRQRRFGGLQ